MLEIASCSHKWIWSMIFIRVPKNASTSIYSHLGDLNLIKKHEKIFNDVLLKKKLYKKWFSPTHAKPNEIYGILGNTVHNYMSFGIVRNPFDRAVSMFQFAKENKLGELYGEANDLSFKSFCEIMKENHSNKVKDFIATHQQTEWFEGAFKPNFILRFENLKNDFQEMLDVCSIKHINSEIPHQNSSKRSAYKDYYSSESQKIIENIFEKDLDIFKYLY